MAGFFFSPSVKPLLYKRQVIYKKNNPTLKNKPKPHRQQ